MQNLFSKESKGLWMSFTLIYKQHKMIEGFDMDGIKELRKGFLKQAGLRKQELENELSQCDLSIQDALHYLENEKCDAVGMVKTAKLIKELRHKRRAVKVEWDQVVCLLNTIRAKNIARFEQRTDYTYRTNIMDDIRHKN